VLIEAMSYRLGAHSTSDDPSGYRTKEEEAKWRRHDPISRMKNWMFNQHWWDETQDTSLFEQYRAEVLAAVKVAEVIDKPHIDTMITDVYDHPSAQLQAQLDDVKAHVKKYPDAYPFTAGKF
jgi:2-oxoisovalerate dehydrogenase E1 component alpha subunit